MEVKSKRELERVLKALANQRRLKILSYLRKKKEATVGDIAGEIKLSFRSTSKHLGILFALTIVEREQHGTQVFYSLAPPRHSVVRHVLSIL